MPPKGEMWSFFEKGQSKKAWEDHLKWTIPNLNIILEIDRVTNSCQEPHETLKKFGRRSQEVTLRVEMGPGIYDCTS